MHFVSLMFRKLKSKVKQRPAFKRVLLELRHPLVLVFGYIYGSYLTIRFVDQYKKFPAILFKNGLIRLHIRKGFGAKFIIGDRLIISPLGVTRTPSLIQMGDDATVHIENEFIIGDDVRIATFNSGEIYIGGKNNESASGISARSILLVHQKLVVGCDTIIAWDTFITDSDWHPIEGRPTHADTIIGNHVWIAVGAKVLKGSVIGDGSIVRSGAVVSGGNYPAKSLLVGAPARIAKSSISTWHRDMDWDA